MASAISCWLEICETCKLNASYRLVKSDRIVASRPRKNLRVRRS